MGRASVPDLYRSIQLHQVWLDRQERVPEAGKVTPLTRVHKAPARATFPQLSFASRDFCILPHSSLVFWTALFVLRRTYRSISLRRTCSSSAWLALPFLSEHIRFSCSKRGKLGGSLHSMFQRTGVTRVT
ncbi:lanosterol synthase isoform X3, partial [Tachysurus ichikawai]